MASSGTRIAASSAQQRRRGFFIVTTVGAGLLGLPGFAPHAPRLVWNASASTPRGLYLVAPGALIRPGDMVVAWPPAAARRMAAARRYLPQTVPLVKRVAAISGDRICARGSVLIVRGRIAAHRRARDAAGRALPWWKGCGVLPMGNVLLLGSAPGSFDGRYFGPSRASALIGRARLIWPR